MTSFTLISEIGSYSGPAESRPICPDAAQAQGIHEYLNLWTGQRNQYRAIKHVSGYPEYLQLGFTIPSMLCMDQRRTGKLLSEQTNRPFLFSLYHIKLVF